MTHSEVPLSAPTFSILFLGHHCTLDIFDTSRRIIVSLKENSSLCLCSSLSRTRLADYVDSSLTSSRSPMCTSHQFVEERHLRESTTSDTESVVVLHIVLLSCFAHRKTEQGSSPDKRSPDRISINNFCNTSVRSVRLMIGEMYLISLLFQHVNRSCRVDQRAATVRTGLAHGHLSLSLSNAGMTVVRTKSSCRSC